MSLLLQTLRLHGIKRTGLFSLTSAGSVRYLSDIDRKQLTVTKTTKPKEKPANSTLVFGKTLSDHMLEIEYDSKNGWGKPVISPYHNLNLDPSCSVFHYALELFEGLKAYKDKDNKIRLFRPDKNMERMVNSAQRIAFPKFDGNQLVECIKELLRVDESWIPKERGYSLYLRPTMISIQEGLGVSASSKILLYVISSPVGPYYKSGFNPVKLLADTTYVRAWPGGTGAAKLGANYAPTIMPQKLAAAKGFDQIMWLFGPDHQLTEVGTMNLFVYWKNEKGEKELITPPLDGSILPGVTRDSVIELVKKWKECKVSEAPVNMKQIVKAANEKRIIEVFGAGTAAIISPVKMIHYQGVDYNIPLDPEDSSKKAGKLATKLVDTILGIQYGEIESEWSVVV